MNWSLLVAPGVVILGAIFMLYAYVFFVYETPKIWFIDSRFSNDELIDEVNAMGPYEKHRAMTLAIRYNAPSISSSKDKRVLNDRFDSEKNERQKRLNEHLSLRKDQRRAVLR